MTSDDRAIALQGLGYTPRQSAFLALVAVHGGYFLRRQFLAFLGQIDGGVVTDFLDKLVSRRHAARQLAARGAHIYHLCARPVYRAIGLEDSRNRRPAFPSSIAAKLMAVDVVLPWRDRVVLGTEAEKVQFFTEHWALALDRLPAKTFQSVKRGGPPTTRYFVDKAPIALTPGSAEVTVAYVPGWATGMEGFQTFLTDYRRLCLSLPEVTILYCTTRPDRVEVARRVWARTFGAPLPGQPDPPDPAALREHFRHRRAQESGTGTPLPSAAAAHWVQERRRFAAPAFQALYRRWCVAGDVVLEDWRRAQPRRPAGPVPRFDRLMLNGYYPWLATTATAPQTPPADDRSAA